MDGSAGRFYYLTEPDDSDYDSDASCATVGGRPYSKSGDGCIYQRSDRGQRGEDRRRCIMCGGRYVLRTSRYGSEPEGADNDKESVAARLRAIMEWMTMTRRRTRIDAAALSWD